MEQENNTHQEEHQLSKKEQNALRRAQKEQARINRTRARKIKKFLTWGIVLAAIVGLIYWIIVASIQAEKSRPGQQAKIQDAGHIDINDEHPPYTTNPPTSGPHGASIRFGVYQEELRDENVVHNLEHGGVWITYTNLSTEDVNKLEEIGRKYSGRAVVSPRSANDSNVAVVSWGRIMKLDTVDVGQITEYVKRNFNKSPEQLAR
tara:strand:+ start:2592 stop:3206 length:615 start_codon:yes stop_codon:yes gene_type:complete